MVLPAPTGPVTTVNGHHRVPWAITSVIRGRCTTHSGTSGAVILDVRTGSPPEAACRLGLVTICLAAWVAIVNLRWGPSRAIRPGHQRVPHPHHHETSDHWVAHHTIRMKSGSPGEALQRSSGSSSAAVMSYPSAIATSGAAEATRPSPVTGAIASRTSAISSSVAPAATARVALHS